MRQISRMDDIAQCVECILDSCGNHVVLAIPLGLGKPNNLVNALYRRIALDAGKAWLVEGGKRQSIRMASGPPAVIAPGVKDSNLLARMGLAEPKSLKEHLLARVLTGALNRAG